VDLQTDRVDLIIKRPTNIALDKARKNYCLGVQNNNSFRSRNRKNNKDLPEYYCSAYDIPPMPYDAYFKRYEDFEDDWLYWGTYPNVCLDPDQMNYHYESMRDELIASYKPSGKVVSNLWVGYDLINYSRIHALSVVYSKKNHFEAVQNYPHVLEPIP
jgi:hypothetical protein